GDPHRPVSVVRSASRADPSRGAQTGDEVEPNLPRQPPDAQGTSQAADLKQQWPRSPAGSPAPPPTRTASDTEPPDDPRGSRHGTPRTPDGTRPGVRPSRRGT